MCVVGVRADGVRALCDFVGLMRWGRVLGVMVELAWTVVVDWVGDAMMCAVTLCARGACVFGIWRSAVSAVSAVLCVVVGTWLLLRRWRMWG